MNHIHALQTQLNHANKQLAYIEKSVTDFMAHLHSDKFRGVDSQGERKDWIATGDVLNWLREVRLQSLRIESKRICARIDAAMEAVAERPE